MTENTLHLTANNNQAVVSSKLTLSKEPANNSSSLDEVNLILTEAAVYCRMAVPTFRMYLSRGEISGIKLGKAWLLTKTELDTFRNRYRIKSNAEIAERSNEILMRTRR